MEFLCGWMRLSGFDLLLDALELERELERDYHVGSCNGVELLCWWMHWSGVAMLVDALERISYFCGCAGA